MLNVTDKSISGVYGLAEFIAATKDDAHNPENKDTLNRWRNENNDASEKEWMGLENEIKDGEMHEDCTRRLIEDGWPEGLELLNEIANKITAPVPVSIRRTTSWRDAGDDVDMQRIWSGNLDKAWRTTSRANRTGPNRIRILIDAIEGGFVEAKHMRWKGASAMKLCDLLTEAGYNVQLESCVKTKCDGQDLDCRIIVKDYEQPMIVSSIAATTILPAFFRSLIHSWGLIVAKKRRYDISMSVPDDMPANAFKDGDDNSLSFVIPKSVRKEEDAANIVNKILTEIDRVRNKEME